MIRLSNGQWSAPAFVAPNNISGGLMFGADAYNAILILNSDTAVNGFMSHHFTIGSEVHHGTVRRPCLRWLTRDLCLRSLSLLAH
jgi:lipid-binding SYLF domain-containing protein